MGERSVFDAGRPGIPRGASGIQRVSKLLMVLKFFAKRCGAPGAATVTLGA
jgi:hypothetical protein